MPEPLPSRARVVIIGGGVVGCSIAYHLTLRGETDVVLLERSELTSGTTWHAAGLVGQLRSTRNLTMLAKHTTGLFATLEEETGQATGFRQPGSVSIAATEARMEELKRGASMARAFGLPVEVVTTDEIADLVPIARLDDIVGGVRLPDDGVVNPVDVTQALARGARNRGAIIREHAPVERVIIEGDRAVGVIYREDGTEHEIRADVVVVAAGMWSPQVVRDLGVTVPLHAAEHFYIVTEEIPDLPANLPVLRDPDGCAYIKEDAGKLLIGWFEPVAKPWGSRTPGGGGGVPADFSFGTLPEDIEHVTPLLEMAAHRIPLLEEAGIRLFFNGPESFTPDDRYLLGETPEVAGLYLACGFNSIGIQSSGGAGKVLADWIIDGHPPMDLWDVDIRRMMPFQSSSAYLHDRTTEALGLLYAMHWPFLQPATARGVRRSALHDRLAERGACFGELAGWERANWFAPPGVEPRYAYSYGRQNWFDYSAEEHRAVREQVGLFDQSSFACFLVQGPDAEAALGRICANDVAVDPGRIVYTQWLNERGTIEADVTVTRLAEDQYLVVTGAAHQTRDLAWLRSHIPADARCAVADVTSGYAVLGVMGPRSRDLLQELTPDDMSNAAFPFGTSREIELGYTRIRASRITYVGELGWELYIPTEFAATVFDTIVDAGDAHGLRMAGYHALNSLRIEKAYRHWGHDISPDETPLEAGLAFAVAWDKPGGFLGREALLAQREAGVHRRLATFRLPANAPFAYHNEPIWRGDAIVGHVTSGMYGHTIGAPLALGYVHREDGVADRDWVESGDYRIEIACEEIPATATLRPLYDPDNARIKM